MNLRQLRYVCGIAEAGFNISRAAAILGVDRGTLYHKIERHGLQRTTATR